MLEMLRAYPIPRAEVRSATDRRATNHLYGIVRMALTFTLAITLLAPAAHASLSFSNLYQRTVWVAVADHDSGGCGDSGNWRVRGWWQLAPGESKTVVGGPLFLFNRVYYFYA